MPPALVPDPAAPRAHADRALLRRLVGVARPHAGWAAGALGLIFLLSALVVSLPWLQGQIVSDLTRAEGLGAGSVWDRLWPADEPRAGRGAHLALLAVVFMAVHLCKFAAEAASMFVLQQFAQRVVHDLRTRLFAHLQRVPIGYYHRTPVGTLVTRVSTDVEALNEFLSAGMTTLVRDVVIMASAGVVMPLLIWDLGLVAVALLPLVVVVLIVFRALARRAYRAMVRLRSMVAAHLAESLTGMAVLQLFAAEARRQADFDRLNDEFCRRAIASVRLWAVFSPTVTFLAKAALALVLAYGAHLASAGRLDLGTLAAFLWWTQLYFDPVREIAEKYNIFQSAMASAERVFTVLDEPADLALGAPVRVARVRGHLEFRGVTFGYDPARPVLADVSFEIAPGQRVALVGPTGAGKSTLIRLLLRWYDPQQGAILLDGQRLDTLEPRSLRARLGVVPQDVQLFHGSIRENLRLWNPAYDDAAVVAAARRVHADRFIARRPDGYDFEVQEGGARLSAGERQLLSFARALVYEPDLLVLDEATALVDTQTEALIQDALAALTRGRTSLIVAHRLSTIRTADLILVLHQGRIVERGRHHELIAQGGRYAQLSRLQAAQPSGC